MEEIDGIDWNTVQFKDDDVLKLKTVVVKRLAEVTEENINRFSKNGYYYSFEFEEIVNRIKSDVPNFLGYVFYIARIKKYDLLLQQVEKDSNLYSSEEKEKIISDLKMFYGPLTGWSIPRDRNYFGDYDPENNTNLTLKDYVQNLSTFYKNVDKSSPSLIPTQKNIEKLNDVAFIQREDIRSDAGLLGADKLKLFKEIAQIVKEAEYKIKKEAGLIYKEEPEIRHMLSPEELSVFTKRIEDVYQGKAKPKVTKEEAIQAVSTVTSATVSSSSQATVTANGETKKDYQASKWFKESGKWYYNDLSGNLVRNRWVGRYYLKADASMAASEWIYDEDYKSWFYVDSTGSYVEKAWQGEYYLKRGGYMAKSEWVFDSQYDSWYYLNQDGKYARNQWIKDGDKWYYLLADGKLAKNMTINGYKVNEKGEWV
ncbi:N-acetylmuramoyl-L-alanine amidase family protein [Streptococcus sp. k-628]|uniref:N-acetylmuramoyl-L-alanine amidase family protein n=1 Tax=Streptococcus sp. k-628 TaxID=2582635 RepID=UPI001F035D72|nr:N-acetylmuramoyl-L-alanine amidase family protein [Streptococcus sp. k-628]